VRAVRDLVVGADIDATVTRVTPYGAFARSPHGVSLAQRRSFSRVISCVSGPLRSTPIGAGCRFRSVKPQEMSCTQLGQPKMRTYNRNQMTNTAMYL
jgi:hypothetical protein